MGRARWDFIGVVFDEEEVREEERRGWGGAGISSSWCSVA
jgi:hypothetical protein